MTTVRMLFLGASRLVGLMERFRAAAVAEEVGLDLLTMEDASPWHAVGAAGAARVLAAPAFAAPEFDRHLLDTIRRERVDVVIPSIDPATRVVARLAQEIRSAGGEPVASRADLCEAMHDKAQAEEFFRTAGLPIPDGPAYPRLAKPRFGASSRGQVLFKDHDELAFWETRNRLEDYLVQPFVRGTEFSVDAYVRRDGRLQGAVARVREVVSGGEVMVTRTERDEAVLGVAARVAAIPGWYGPLNIQIMRTDAGPRLIEVNPRFSSGVTCAIEAGLDSPRYILRERLGRPLPEPPVAWRGGLCMTRSRKDHFLWLS